MPLRKRPHPLSKDGTGKRYNVCQRCDTKYLNLQLGHVKICITKELRVEPDITGTGNREYIRGVVKFDERMSRVSRGSDKVETDIREEQIQDFTVEKGETGIDKGNQEQDARRGETGRGTARAIESKISRSALKTQGVDGSE